MLLVRTMAPFVRTSSVSKKALNYIAANARLRLKSQKLMRNAEQPLEPREELDNLQMRLKISGEKMQLMMDQMTSISENEVLAEQKEDEKINSLELHVNDKVDDLKLLVDSKLKEMSEKIATSGTQVVQSLMALIGTSMKDIHDKIDALHHKCAEIDKVVADVKVKVSTTSLECCTWDHKFECFKELTVTKLEQLEMLHIAYEKENPLTAHANVIQQLRTELYDRMLPSREWVDERIDEFLEIRHELKKPKKKNQR